MANVRPCRRRAARFHRRPVDPCRPRVVPFRRPRALVDRCPARVAPVRPVVPWVLDPRAVVAAAMVGRVRRIVVGADDVPINMGRTQRLFRGDLREAVLLAHRHCTYTGCLVTGGRCQADHLQPHSQHGDTNIANGAPACRFHNPFKNNGSRTVRDAKGRYHTLRPDGTTIGWPVLMLNMRFLHHTGDPADDPVHARQ